MRIRKLDSLTSLRFFASAAIVFMHSRPSFNTTRDLFVGWPFHFGVTFFFVLSGFILTYVYRETPSHRDFYIARFTRIWPAHIAALLLLLVLLPRGQWIWDGANPILVPLANITLLQSIIPIPEYYFSLNGVSWSLSTEVFFYLAFPFLLADWSKTWMKKLGAGLLLAGAIVFLSDFLALPPFSPARFLEVTNHGLVYVNPLVRIFEFMLGMGAAKVAIRYGVGTGAQGDVVRWTAAEAAGLTLAIYMASYGVNLSSKLDPTGESALATYLTHSSGAIFFALVIAIFAFEGGALSRGLRCKPLVLLGEISFSLYLVHQVLLRWYAEHLANFAGISDGVRLGSFWLVSLALAFIIWRFFELPMRGWLRRVFAGMGKNTAALPREA